jgi:hypothetical protein
MAEWNVKHALRDVPQPYKLYIGRTLMPIIFIPALIFAAVTEGFGWCKEMAYEMCDAWREIKEW